jgi:hypothetical protein
MRTSVPRRAVLVAVLAALGIIGPVPVVDARTPAPAPPLYGVTIDRITGIAMVVSAERLLPEHPTTRVYFNVLEPASYYASAVTLLHTVSQVMGEARLQRRYENLDERLPGAR